MTGTCHNILFKQMSNLRLVRSRVEKLKRRVEKLKAHFHSGVSFNSILKRMEVQDLNQLGSESGCRARLIMHYILHVLTIVLLF